MRRLDQKKWTLTACGRIFGRSFVQKLRQARKPAFTTHIVASWQPMCSSHLVASRVLIYVVFTHSFYPRDSTKRALVGVSPSATSSGWGSQMYELQSEPSKNQRLIFVPMLAALTIYTRLVLTWAASFSQCQKRQKLLLGAVEIYCNKSHIQSVKVRQRFIPIRFKFTPFNSVHSTSGQPQCLSQYNYCLLYFSNGHVVVTKNESRSQ